MSVSHVLQCKHFQKQSILTLLLCHSQLDNHLSAGSTCFDRVTSDLHYHVRSWLWQTDTRKACITQNRCRQAVSLSKACHKAFCSSLSSGMVGGKIKIRMICIVVWLMSPSLSVLQEFEYATLYCRHDKCIVSFRSLANVPCFQRNSVYWEQQINENKSVALPISFFIPQA